MKNYFLGISAQYLDHLSNWNWKKEARPFTSPAYTIPKAFEKIAKKEVGDLCNIGVLIENVRTAYQSPSFFRPKKNGGVRFLSDLRKLNKCLLREPYPLPNIDDIIWKLEGFTFATCLDLNRGYYHFVLDSESQKLCGIILPWGSYCYGRLPQGLMVSCDIFQHRMSSIFQTFTDVLVFMDNILLFTKKIFDHHLQRLTTVLQTLKENNLHVHIEDTFLASQGVDYLAIP